MNRVYANPGTDTVFTEQLPCDHWYLCAGCARNITNVGKHSFPSLPWLLTTFNPSFRRSTSRFALGHTRKRVLCLIHHNMMRLNIAFVQIMDNNSCTKRLVTYINSSYSYALCNHDLWPTSVTPLYRSHPFLRMYEFLFPIVCPISYRWFTRPEFALGQRRACRVVEPAFVSGLNLPMVLTKAVSMQTIDCQNEPL